MAGQQGDDQQDGGRKPMRPINARADDDLHALIDEAVAVSDSKDKSHWIREALTAGALKELSAYRATTGRTSTHRRSATPAPSLGSVREHTLGYIEARHEVGCVHPPSARWIGVASETCTLCGAETRRRL